MTHFCTHMSPHGQTRQNKDGYQRAHVCIVKGCILFNHLTWCIMNTSRCTFTVKYNLQRAKSPVASTQCTPKAFPEISRVASNIYQKYNSSLKRQTRRTLTAKQIKKNHRSRSSTLISGTRFVHVHTSSSYGDSSDLHIHAELR